MVEVRRVQRLTPHMVRVTFGGEDLEGFQAPIPTQHVKLIFPSPGQDKPVIPDFSAGRPSASEQRPTLRTYTPRRYDADLLELDVDFVLHGDGPAASWASKAKAGDMLAVAGPGGRYLPDPEATWYVIAGDETALPAIGTLLESLPSSTRADVYVEVADAAEELPLTTAAQARFTWLHRGAEQPGHLLEAAMYNVELPTHHGRVWVACESSVMRNIRKHLLGERHIDPDSLVTRGYWKAGEANHPDHDYGQDEA